MVVEQSEKKRAELYGELALLEQKIQAIKEEMRNIDERLTAKLEEKIKEKRTALEGLESQKKDMEKQLEELQDNQKSPSVPVLCQYCGSENLANANFCEKCGKEIGVAGGAPDDVKLLEKAASPA